MQNSRRYKQKTNFDCQIHKKRKALQWEKINSRLNQLRIGIYNYFFYGWIHISIVQSSRKIRVSISKIKGMGLEKLILIARYKNWFYFQIFKFRLKLNRKRGVYTCNLSLRKFSLFLFYLIQFKIFPSHGRSMMRKKGEGEEIRSIPIREGVEISWRKINSVCK